MSEKNDNKKIVTPKKRAHNMNKEEILSRLKAELTDPEGKTFEDFAVEFTALHDKGIITEEESTYLLKMAQKRERVREIYDLFKDDFDEEEDTTVYPEINRIIDNYGSEDGSLLLRLFFTYSLIITGFHKSYKGKKLENKILEYTTDFHTNILNSQGMDFLKRLDKIYKEESDNWELKNELIQCYPDYLDRNIFDKTNLDIDESLKLYKLVCNSMLNDQEKTKELEESPAISTQSKNNVENNNSPLFCKKCGKRIPSNSEFCQFCGDKVERLITPDFVGLNPPVNHNLITPKASKKVIETSPLAKPVMKNKLWSKVIIAIVLVAVIVTGLFVLIKSLNQPFNKELDPFNISSFLGKPTSDLLTKKAYKSGYDYDETIIDFPELKDNSFVTYTYSPKFTYMNQLAGNTTFSLVANYDTKIINLVYYSFPIDQGSALYHVKNIQEKISSYYGDPEIHVTRMTGNIIGRELSLPAFFKQIEIWNPGIYDLRWEYENYNITLGVTINPYGTSDARVQVSKK